MMGLLQKELGGEFLVESAGISRDWAGLGQPANELSVQCLKERGIDLSNHESRWVGDLDLSEFSHVVCVGETESWQIAKLFASASGRGMGKISFLVPNRENGGVPDPYGKGLYAYQFCLALLEETIPLIADKIRG